MTEELKEIGLDVGHRRVGRLMRQNGISVVRTRKHKVTTDSDHKFNIAPNLLERDFCVNTPNQKCPLIDTAYRLPGSGQQSHEARSDDTCPKDGYRIPRTSKGLHSPYGQGQPILFARLPENLATTWVQGVSSHACKHALPGSG